MGNPISDLWGAAVAEWHAVTRGYVAEWQDMYDTVTLFDWRPKVNAAFTYLAKIIQDATILAATSNADTVGIGRDTSGLHRNALVFLRNSYVPRWADNARNEAINYGAAQLLISVRVLERRLRSEHAEMVLRVLREQLGREVADDREHADMVTRVAQEANTRALADQHLDQVLTARIAAAKAQVLAVVDQVRQQLAAQIAQVLKYAQSIPGLVDQEAAAGYDPTLKDRAGGLQKLLDVVVAHDPLIADVVKQLAGWLVDLAEVDNPLLRIAAQLVLKQLVDRLGLNTALGALLNDVLGPVLGGGRPKTLTAVTAQIGKRLNASDDGLAQLAPLAPEADQLREMGTLAFDAALLGYLAAAIADPVAAADDTATALDTVAGPLLAPLRGLLGVP
jgi:hypothetical protein